MPIGKTGRRQRDTRVVDFRSAGLLSIPLTPAQKLYSSAKAWDVKLFQLSDDMTESTVYSALESPVSHHRILRANITTERGNKQLKLTSGGRIHPLAHRRVETPVFDGTGKELLDGGDGEWDGGERQQCLSSQGTCLARYLRLDLHHTIADASSWNVLQCDHDNAALGNAPGPGLSVNSFGTWAKTQSGSGVEFDDLTLDSKGVRQTRESRGQDGYPNGENNYKSDLAVLEADAATNLSMTPSALSQKTWSLLHYLSNLPEYAVCLMALWHLVLS